MVSCGCRLWRFSAQTHRAAGGESSDVSGRYRVRPLQENSGDKDLLRLENGVWQPQYRFTDTEYDLTAYAGMCHYYSTASDSHFNQGILCTRATKVGRLTLTEDALTITEHGEKKKISVPEHGRAVRKFALEFRYRFGREASMTHRRRRRRRRRRTRRTSTAVGGLTVMFILVIGAFLVQEATDRGLIDLTPPPVRRDSRFRVRLVYRLFHPTRWARNWTGRTCGRGFGECNPGRAPIGRPGCL